MGLFALCGRVNKVESVWNVMAHSDARGRKWRGNWRMEWIASTLHTTSEHCVSSITTADAHTSAACSRLNWRPPRRFKWTRPFRSKDEIWFLRVCHHISTGFYSRAQYDCVALAVPSGGRTVWKPTFRQPFPPSFLENLFQSPWKFRTIDPCRIITSARRPDSKTRNLGIG